jgi:competence protein ComEC
MRASAGRSRCASSGPHGNVNPHGFDYEGWLLQQGIRATGYVRPAEANRRIDARVPGLMYAIERLSRGGTASASGRPCRMRPMPGVLVALAVGDQRSISRRCCGDVLPAPGSRTWSPSAACTSPWWRPFFAALTRAGCWRRTPALALRWPAQQAGVLAGFAAALVYCLLAGWGVPAQRTLYMLGCVALALVLRRETAPSRVLALALGMVLLLDPWAVTAAGLLVVLRRRGPAVSGGYSGRIGREGWLHTAVRTQWAVTLGLIPALLVLFQQFSLVSPLANAIAIPW